MTGVWSIVEKALEDILKDRGADPRVIASLVTLAGETAHAEAQAPRTCAICGGHDDKFLRCASCGRYIGANAAHRECRAVHIVSNKLAQQAKDSQDIKAAHGIQAPVAATYFERAILLPDGSVLEVGDDAGAVRRVVVCYDCACRMAGIEQ